jgi:protein ImuA
MSKTLASESNGGVARLVHPVSGESARSACITTGMAAIDAALPWGGLPCGLHELASPSGDAAAAGFAATLIARRPGPVLWCRSRRTGLNRGDPYGPGMAGFGLSPDRLILADADRPVDLLWAMEEGARTRGLATVVGEGVMADLTASRRLQLAAEAGRALVLLLAEEGAQPAAATALTRWLVRAEPSLPEAGGPGLPHWDIELRRCRGGAWPRSWKVEWDDTALSLALVSDVPDRSLATAAG